MSGNKNSGRKKGIPNRVNRLRHEEFEYALLGKVLKDARRITNLPQKDVANSVLMDRYPNRLADWESGKTTHNLTMDNLILLCNAYGIPPSEILYMYEEMKGMKNEQYCHKESNSQREDNL